MSAGDEGPSEERAAQRGSDRILAKARAQRKRRELQREVRIIQAILHTIEYVQCYKHYTSFT